MPKPGSSPAAGGRRTVINPRGNTNAEMRCLTNVEVESSTGVSI
jgi:hypothetical protein